MPDAKETVFQKADRPDVALITNHGYAGVEIPIGGAPDTGGQVAYVNALARTLETLGYRVTIFARGGFRHFGIDEIRREPEYLSDHARYVFVPGGGDTFIRKEDIAVALDEEVDWLDTFIRQEAAARNRPPWAMYEFVNTHYWDAAVMGMRLVERWRDDVAAEAITDLLTGAVPAEGLRRMRDERHWRALGEAPAYHLGALLLDGGAPGAGPGVGPSAATPLIERVRAAASRWATASWQARDGEADTIVAAVEETLERGSPPAESEPALCGTARPPAATKVWHGRPARDPTGETPVPHVSSRDAKIPIVSSTGVSPVVAPDDRAAPVLRQLATTEALGAAILAVCRGRAEQLERELQATDRHVWTPHSLAAIKEENFRDQPLEVRRDLKFCERRNHERTVCNRTRAFAATSAEIAERLRTHYRVADDRVFYFPPCVDSGVFRRHAGEETDAAYRYLADVSDVPIEKLRSGRIVFETSRMDQTKRKDLLLDAFVRVARARSNAYLFIGGGPENDLFKLLIAQRDARPELRGRAFLTGFIPEKHIGPLFSVADVYVSASEMEGFGMSVSQAAAAGTAVVSSDLIPFVVQYAPNDAIIVRAGDVEGFTAAILQLLEDDAGRAARGARLVERVKVLDWEAQTSAFLDFLRERGIAAMV
ncbi:MAG: glycosyltransferase [Phycisphaerae bacterium]|nr:glycosyltransferase [Phycisphaerae bacterium]